MAGKGSKPGERRGGRAKGTPNKITKSVKDAFQAAFDELQQVEGVRLGDWGKDNPTDFYKIASKLIPTDVNATLTTQESAAELLARGLGRAPKAEG